MKRKHSLRQKCLIVAIGSMLASGIAYGQSTVGSIYGQVPAGEGQTIVIRNTATGATREIAVAGNGRYTAAQLPVGTYTVTLQRDGKAVQTQENVVLRVGQGENISFTGGGDNVQQLDGISVKGSRAPSIDVTSVDSRTVITSEQLRALPLGRSAEAAALLAPGVVSGTTAATGRFGAPLASFGGASVVENVYYVNGFNTTDPNQGQGGLTLPYGAIDQEEAYTGGYGAKYGRSNGGVLNIIGKSGTNEWKFGGSVVMQPESFRASQEDLYYTSMPVSRNPATGQLFSPATGLLYHPRSENSSQTYTYDAYVGGPILRDRLFFFLAAEQSETKGKSVGTVNSTPNNHSFTEYTTKNPKLYAKINWNITDNHLLELTGDYNEVKSSGTQYHYDFLNRQQGAVTGYNDDTTTGGRFWAAKYTGYLTDNLTLNAQYGRMNLKVEGLPVGLNTTDPNIGNSQLQNPTYTGGTPITNAQTRASVGAPTEYLTKTARIDLNWVLGKHSLSFGLDRLESDVTDINSSVSTGPGYDWSYGLAGDPTLPIDSFNGVPAPADFPNGAGGYYVVKTSRHTGGDLFTTQRAEYVEDNWQVTDRLLLSLGIRHDSYTNQNGNHDTYVKQDNLWQPRLGFSWDVNGDSSLKVFGNIGRYDMNQPLASDAWLVNSSLVGTQYFTYGGIAADGQPTGLTQMTPEIHINGNDGRSPDFHQIYAKDLKPQAQDEFILGFAKVLDSRWTIGAKFTRRELRSVIDDYCETQVVIDQAVAQGFDPDIADGQCWQINAGVDNVFTVKDTAGAYHDVRVTREQFGFPKLSRKYNGLNFFAEHAFDGKWYGKFDYTWSRAYGNSEGQSQTRTDSVGGTQQTDWDNRAIMVNANGPYGYDHTHQLKLFGYYQLTPEWQVSGNLTMISGGPKYCLGYYGPDQEKPFGYSGFYWCDGQWTRNANGTMQKVLGTGRPSAPGDKGRLGWNNSLDLGVHYRPAFADHKLGIHLDVFNLFNEQTALNRFWRYHPDLTGPGQDWPRYQVPTNTQAPRSVRLSITYDY